MALVVVLHFHTRLNWLDTSYLCGPWFCETTRQFPTSETKTKTSFPILSPPSMFMFRICVVMQFIHSAVSFHSIVPSRFFSSSFVRTLRTLTKTSPTRALKLSSHVTDRVVSTIGNLVYVMSISMTFQSNVNRL